MWQIICYNLSRRNVPLLLFVVFTSLILLSDDACDGETDLDFFDGKHHHPRKKANSYKKTKERKVLTKYDGEKYGFN